VDLLRGLVADAVSGRSSPRVGRLRLTVVGADEAGFLVNLDNSSCVIDDDHNDADADLWLAAADVPHLIHGFSVQGVRQAGDPALVAALADLLRPGASPLGVRLGAARGR
jgi:hypothetical protein